VLKKMGDKNNDTRRIADSLPAIFCRSFFLSTYV